jgi:hypothetical protein
MTLLRNDCNKQVSPISEGFTEIRINLHLAREISDNTTHVSHEGTTNSHSSRHRSKSQAGLHLFLVHVFHVIPHAGLSMGVSYTIPIYITAWEVRDHPTRRPPKLLSLRDPINLVCVSTKSNLLIRPRWSVLNWHGWRATTSELWIWHQTTITISIQYSPHPANWLRQVSHRATIRSLT